ncbi:MAG: hypothetical protein U0414_42910 [Polyangiaceae bacterium]
MSAQVDPQIVSLHPVLVDAVVAVEPVLPEALDEPPTAVVEPLVDASSGPGTVVHALAVTSRTTLPMRSIAAPNHPIDDLPPQSYPIDGRAGSWSAGRASDRNAGEAVERRGDKNPMLDFGPLVSKEDRVSNLDIVGLEPSATRRKSRSVVDGMISTPTLRSNPT